MKKIETELAIVAAGPAGLCAAVAAAELGVEVAVFEKSGTIGGTANQGMGIFGVESRIQKNSMIPLTKEDAFKRFMDYVHWQSDAQLVHDYFWKSGNTVDWLEDMGVRFAGAMRGFPDSEQTWHVVVPDGGGRPGPRAASAMNRVIYERALELGVQFYLNTPVSELIKKDGEIVGLRAVDDEGEEYEVSSIAVIVATGGFGTNPEMVKKYCNYDLHKDLFGFDIPGIVGDGHKMAWAAGAGKSRMEMERIMGSSIPGAFSGEYPGVRLFNQAGPIAVNKSGYRVCNEHVMQNFSVAGNIIDFQQDRTVYMIIGESLVEYYRKNGLDYAGEVFHDDPTENFEARWEKVAERFPDAAFCAESVAELAEKLDVSTKNLSKTIERYNNYCARNHDDDFGKSYKFLHPIEGRLFAYRCAPGAYGSLGGIRINHRFEVLTDDYEIIPGFYAAGSDVNTLYNGTYYFYFPGSTMGFAVNSGRMAGEYAANYILGNDA